MTPLLVNEAQPTLRASTLPEALERAAAAGAFLWTADKDTAPKELALRALLDRASHVAQHLLSHGMERGERVVVMLPTGEDWLAGFFGTLLAGEPLPYARRITGRRYAPATIAPGDRAVTADRVTLLCADALDPPLVPGLFDRVVALNLLDSVASPRGLLQVLDGLCAPGGELIVTSPYAWASSVMAEHERLGDDDPAAALAAILRAGTDLRARYVIEDEADLAWTLSRDARSAVTYWTHYFRARKI